jgi:superfamily I DNA and/or RNA helicase
MKVRGQCNGYMQDWKRFNVAVTRAHALTVGWVGGSVGR